MSTNEKILRHRNILVTGGSSGIGRALTSGLLNAGAKVAVISRRNPSQWEMGIPKGWKHNGTWLKADLQEASEVKTAVNSWLNRFSGKIDTLIHCAVSYGGNKRHSFLETTLSQWDEMFLVNIRSQFIVTKITLPFLLQQDRSLIIAITSDVVFSSGAGRIGYASTKIASYKMFLNLSEELRDSKVSIVQIMPKKQVNTPGIRRRRPTNFDFSFFLCTTAFVNPVLSLVQSYGKEFHGKCWEID